MHPPTHPPAPHVPTRGEQRLADAVRAAGWQSPAVTPPDAHIYDVAGNVEVVAIDPGGYTICVDGGDDGHPEGYHVHADDGRSTRRVRSATVPSPNEAVGELERQYRPPERTTGRKG